MRFSVLIPVYNVEQYLDECVASVMNQSFRDFEVILTDDGSTDGSAQKCDDYHARYPEKLRVFHTENRGLISARRIGIANAKGDYCIFVDSDDFVRENMLEVLDCRLREDEKADILLYSFAYITDGRWVKDALPIAADGKIWEADEKRELCEKLIFTNDVTPMWIKACRTSLLQSDPTDYSVYVHKNMSEDVLQSLHLITGARRIKYIRESLYCYRYNVESISRNYTPASFRRMDTTHVYRKILEYLPIWNMEDEEHIDRLNARWFDLTMYFFRKCYAGAENRAGRRAVVDFDWNALLPCLEIDSYAEAADPTALKLYRWYHDKKMLRLNVYFIKNKLYGKYKRMKKSLLKR